MTADEALTKAHETWKAARAALDNAEETGRPSLLSPERGRIFDAEMAAYDALIKAQIAALNAEMEA